jgi:hypothetical protein
LIFREAFVKGLLSMGERDDGWWEHKVELVRPGLLIYHV